MAEAFYPFVENGITDDSMQGETLVVRHAARIAVFDDVAAAPRVVVIEPTDIRSYLEEITKTVTKLAQEQGGSIPFTVIREVVENLIHAYFIEPTISILDQGNTIRFSDQGPGIENKERALEYGTTSATTEMKRYIRGVGSGLPYAQQWLEDKGGSLTVDDNIHQGTIVTISLAHNAQEDVAPTPQELPQIQQPNQVWPAQQPYQSPYPPQPMWQQNPYQNPWPQPQVPLYQQSPYQQAPSPLPAISDRGLLALNYLAVHESVGPRDLTALHGLSEATWSRELSQLDTFGLTSKQGGQKRRLTPQGRAFLGLR